MLEILGHFQRLKTPVLCPSREHGYNGHVGGAMRSANIADLRNHLTRYLKEVRAGQEIIIRDRQLPIAKIVPLAPDGDAEDSALVAAGLMRRAERALPASFWRACRPSLERRVAADALSRDRDND
jgi:prevent-host-death family protein